MRYLMVVLLMPLCLFAQTADQPGVQYASYTLLLVPQKGEGFLVAIDKQQKIVFIPVSSVSKAINEDGVSPVHYGELLQLLRQMGEENQRLKTENDRLWKVAENRPGAPTSVVVQQAPPPPTDPDAERRQMRMMLLRSLLTQRSTVNVNVTDCSRTPALCAGH
ncbi:MAG: hypothetical protein WAN18_23255 [Candidatus Sulfotelmatobacter sp.]